MNASYRWLQALAPGLDAPPEALSERLAALGFPVEGMTFPARELGEIVVARVVEVREHPNADRLRLCDVDAGDGVQQVVCGADNVRAGALYPFAPVGATLPGGLAIREARLRGEVSRGMLCSERELRLGRGHEGIMELPSQGEAFRPGVGLVEAMELEDVRLEVEVTSNRPDLLSHRGIARELAPEGHAGLVDPPIPGEAEGMAERIRGLELRSHEEAVEGERVRIRVEAPELCPRYLGLVVRGVQVGPSPPWLQNRLRGAGARPINNVVDATNYVLLELGQPLHAFDLERLEEETVVVREAAEGEEIRTLDGEDRTLREGMLAICDARRPIAVAGVMGGEESEVGPETTDVLLECALFTPGPVRSTRKALGLSTDASYRFERGVDPQGLRHALERCARILLAVAGGEPDPAILDVNPTPTLPQRVTLRPSRVERVLGVAFPVEEIRALLEPLGFLVEAAGSGDEDPKALSVEVPGYRSWDVTREVDLIEEIARRHGFDRFPDDLGPFRPGTVPDHPLFILEDDLRRELGAWGLLEAQTAAFAPRGEGEVEVLNPVSVEERWLRSSLIPGLVRRVEYNLARGNRDVRLFEVGTAFAAAGPGELPRERTRVGAVLHGRREPDHWASEGADIDLWEVKGLAETVARRISRGGWRVVPWSEAPAGEGNEPFLPALDPRASFRILDRDGREVGRAGRLPEEVGELPPWAGELWALEVALPPDPKVLPTVTAVRLPAHPAVDRDLALVVSDEHPAGAVLDRLREGGGALLRDVSVFDVYRGEGVPRGHRSLAVRLRFRAGDRTLTDAEVDRAVNGALNVLKEEFDVRVRGG